ncbi:hypothetical protein NQ318_021958 [Aromia moschata]|uniref:Uncharacterized protein n=1 Tax=Aromia moschata TaxID=1265417 RepID=A0AAV8XV38_9CUCU|nr:hypothetical protein NQ318_021958 [Aromia moschata]
MKEVLLSLAALTLAVANGLTTFGLSKISSDASGTYFSDNSGAYRPIEGRYHDDNSGAYRGDNSGDYNGQYFHDNSGAYVHDNSGEYVPDNNPYVHEEGNYGGNGGDYRHSSSQFGAGNVISKPVNIPVIRPVVRPPVPSPTTIRRPAVSGFVPSFSTGSDSGISSAAGYGKPVTLKQGNAAGFYENKNYAIIRKIEQVEEDGYHYLYETENGIYGEEEGKVANKGTDDEVMKAKGYFTYTGPDAIVYTVQYTADENGFVPHGDHLPTPPPIPEAILRSLEYQKSLGEL